MRDEDTLVVRQVSRGPIGRLEQVDELDLRLIAALQEHGREPFRRIAGQLGVSDATVRARYRRLREANVVQVSAVTNPLGLGFDAVAMVAIKVTGRAGPLAETLAGWHEVSYVVVTAGQFDVLAEVMCTDREHQHQVVERIRSLDGVVSTESLLYLDLCKHRYDWSAGVGPVPDPPDASGNGSEARVGVQGGGDA